ncbi:MAG: ABC transporter permease [Clostridia bacterium]|nr:ABC transporter permease [Clostridia bacterium]
MKLKRQVFSYPYIVWMLIFILAPMVLIVYFAFSAAEGGLTLSNLVTALTNEIYMQVLVRSVWIALKATAICLLLGYPIAYILSTMKKRTAAILYVLFIVPMWMNFLLRTYAWQVLLDSNGIINSILSFLGLPAQQLLYTEGAVMLGTVYNFLPFMVLPIYSVLVKLDRSLVEAAADLGANPVLCFLKVVLPQSVPGIISGITMVFIPAITTFAISRLLGGGKFLLYGDLIENQFITLGQSAWPVGSALSFILLVLVLISMAIMRRAEHDAGEEGGMLW